jgi:GDSL-like Lipase/Acylhydrolase family
MPGAFTPHRTIVLLLVSLAVVAPARAGARDWRKEPVVPRLGPAVVSHLETVVERGIALGNRTGVFAKFGDSITESHSFLRPLACRVPRWGRWDSLRSTWQFFARTRLPVGFGESPCGVEDSYSRNSVAAIAGWTAADALSSLPDPAPECQKMSAISCELWLLRPSLALIMFGTNDVRQTSAGQFRSNLARVARQVADAGTIAVLSTIPPRDGPLSAKTERFNGQIVALAQNRALPLWNYWRQMSAPGVPASGLSPDGVHPSELCPPCSPIDFSSAGLRQGYALRNLGALLVLDRLQRRVLAPQPRS